LKPRPETGLVCLVCALTVLCVPWLSYVCLDCLMCALTVLCVPYSFDNGLEHDVPYILLMGFRMLLDCLMFHIQALTVLCVPYSGHDCLMCAIYGLDSLLCAIHGLDCLRCAIFSGLERDAP